MITETNAERTLEELRAYQAVVATVLRRGESSSVEKELKTTTAAAIKIQTNSRGRFAGKCYFELRISAIVLQTGFRAMDARHARDKLRYEKQAPFVHLQTTNTSQDHVKYKCRVEYCS